ncbi:MAG: carboxymuconolactone decarboxylase family protein [Phycisphaerales bacterium]|nr:MAG: carboxymuconolactone decarboxylase family protein [Phycisphaerales bacterium]
MAYIKLIDEQEAEGTLARVYDAARKRAGRVYNIFKIQSRSPEALKAFMQLHSAVIRRDSPLTRAQAEMIAVVVSKANGCHY